eukprot:4256884-Pyramimonas_sp.AAC.1
MWPLGCAAAELCSRRPLVCASAEEDPRERRKEVTGKDVIDAIRKGAGLPGQEAVGDFHSASMGFPLSSDVPGVETAA